MIDPAAFRTSMLLATELTIQTAQAFVDFWEAVLAPFDPAAGRARPAPVSPAASPPKPSAAPPPPAAFAPAPPPVANPELLGAVAPEVPVVAALAPLAAAAPAQAQPPAAAGPYPWHAGAPDHAVADLVVYQAQVAPPGPDVPVVETLLGLAANLADICALGVNALHLTPRRQGGGGTAFSADTIDAYALTDPASLADLLPSLNARLAAAGHAPLVAADLSGGMRQVQCLVDLCHLAGVAVLIDLRDEAAVPEFAAAAHLDGVRLAAPDARANDPGGHLIWGGRPHGPAAGDDLRLALRDLLRGTRSGGALPLGALATSLVAAASDAGLQSIATADDVEGLAVLADPEAPDGWTARSRIRLLTALLFAAPGAPSLQAGQAQADADSRRFTRAAVALRGAEPGLRGGGVRVSRCDEETRVFVLHRWVADGSAGRDIIVVANLSGTTLHDYRIGLPRGGWWREVFNTDAFDGALDRPVIGNGGAVDAHDGPLDGFAHSVPMILPPNAALFFTPCN